MSEIKNTTKLLVTCWRGLSGSAGLLDTQGIRDAIDTAQQVETQLKFDAQQTEMQSIFNTQYSTTILRAVQVSADPVWAIG